MPITTVAKNRTVSLPARNSMRLAAIDVGSNSIHMIVAQVDEGDAITTLWRMKEMVGLGRMSFPSHQLSKEAMNRAITTLARFKQAAEQRQCEKILTVATSAIREATNGGELIERANRELGMDIRVVSAKEEARLIYLAVRHALPLKREPYLLIDIGGGSVEFIVGNDKSPLLLESRKLGAARLTAGYVKSDPINNRDQSRLRAHLDEELGPICQQIIDLTPTKVIGTSGTMENIAAMCLARSGSNESGSVIERESFERVFAQILQSKTDDRDRFKGLDDQRKDQIAAGMMIVDELFRRLRFRRIQLCNAALREGIVLDYLGRHVPELIIRREIPDPRRRSVLDLARKCNWHKTHSEQVARLCLRLFDELKGVHGLGADARELIEYASLLHDIGWHISRLNHHKHSKYLIENGSLKGFVRAEIQAIANIARYHRGPTPKKKHDSYMSLSTHERKIVDVGAALLRLADGLDRSHSSVIQELRCRIGKKKIETSLTARGDAALEVWGAERKADWFARVIGREIHFDVIR